MKRVPAAFTVCLVGIALFTAACGGGGGEAEEPDSNGSAGAGGAIVGTHTCKSPEDTEPTVYEFKSDGTVTLTASGFTDSGTWSGDKNKAVMTVAGSDSSLTIKGDRLVFDGAPLYECSNVR